LTHDAAETYGYQRSILQKSACTRTDEEGISMTQNRTSFRKILMRGLWVTALFAICGLSIAGASSSAASAQGVGIQGCIYRGPGFGFGYWGPGFCYPYAYEEASVCRVARQRVMTSHGWRTRLVDVCQ
jgi:hypothetical protein